MVLHAVLGSQGVPALCSRVPSGSLKTLLQALTCVALYFIPLSLHRSAHVLQERGRRAAGVRHHAAGDVRHAAAVGQGA
jgi:hypothetical protein